MIEFLKKDKWSPYLVGALIGLLLTGLVGVGHTIGVSTAVARVGALAENAIVSSHVENTPYFKKLLSDGVFFDWRILFLVGIFCGAAVASKISKKEVKDTNTIWTKAFGTSRRKRNMAAFIGGFFLLLGARFAGGCTSGHAISGGAQLTITSWVFMMAVFAVGIPVSLILYRSSWRSS